MAKRSKAEEQWRNAIVRYAVESIDTLIPHPDNPKIHPPEQRDALVGSMNEFGIVAPLLVNERSHRMLDGHKRLIEAHDRGQQTFPVLYVDVPVEKEGAFLASFDPIGWLASNDDALFENLLSSVEAEDSMLAGFFDELRASLSGATADIDSEYEPGDSNMKGLRSYVFTLTDDQFADVDAVIQRLAEDSVASAGPSPHRLGNALHRLCKESHALGR